MTRLTAGTPEHTAALSEGQRIARARMAAGEGFIYVAAIDADTVKVGFSLRPDRRVEQIGRHARLLGFFSASISAERSFHKHHQDHQIPGRREHYPRALFIGDSTTPAARPRRRPDAEAA